MSILRCFVWLTMGAVCFAAPRVFADDGPPVVMKVATQPEAKGDVFVGARIRLIVDVLGRDGWANVPTLPTVTVPGAIVFAPDGQSMRLNDTVQGASYSGQRNEWWVYPQRAGELVIAPIEIAITVQTFDPKQKPATISKTTERVSLTVIAPPGFENGDDEVVVTSELTVQQTFSSAAGESVNAKVGDGITRTITRTVAGSPPLVLPPLSFSKIDGTTRYIKQPETSQTSNRGELTGRRTDSVTYVFTRAGEIELPPIDIAWFDSGSNQRRNETLDGVNVQVADVPREAEAAQANASPFRWSIAVAIFLIAVMVGGWLAGRQRLTAWWRARALSERAVYRRLRSDLSAGQVAAINRSMRTWVDTIHPSEYWTLERFFTVHAPAISQTGLEMLYQAMDSSETRIDASQLLQSVQAARTSVLTPNSGPPGNVLMPLNPTAGVSNGVPRIS